MCSKKCGNRKNNLKKRKKQQQVYYRTRQTEENRKTLAHLYENPVLRRSIERDVLKGFNYHFGVCTHLNENPTSGGSILWVHDFGLELTDAHRGTYRIHHDKTTKP